MKNEDITTEGNEHFFAHPGHPVYNGHNNFVVKDKVTWTDNCHKCGAKIFNGFKPKADGTIPDFQEIEAAMNAIGYKLGYNTRWTPGGDQPIKPICSDCSNAESRAAADKLFKRQMRKIKPLLKKVYVCPCCQHGDGYADNVFTTPSKAELEKHIEERHKGSRELRWLMGGGSK